MARPERPLKSLADLAEAPEADRRERGYEHTLREILQQPATWRETEALALESGPTLRGHEGPVLLTGSGSSFYIGESLEPILARDLARPVRAVPAGSLLTDGEGFLPPGVPGTLVSFARSGDSPESCGVVDWFVEHRPLWRHVVLTCNRTGALATRYGEGLSQGQFEILILPERTNDRSLVMTSSFTNLWLAGRFLGGGHPDVARLASTTERIVGEHDRLLAEAASAATTNVVSLGSGARYGAARECALKMLEMTDGRVPAFAESFLGLRHGPMCALREGSLLVGLLASEEPARSYERELLLELEDKNLGARTLLVGPGGDVVHDLRDDDAALAGVVVGQILGLLRSLAVGRKPDAPSATGVITLVVRKFEIH